MVEDRGKNRTAPRRGCRRVLSCFTLLIVIWLLLAGLCLSVLLIRPVSAADAASQPLQVWLLIDNSNSMYDRDGLGSDPDCAWTRLGFS